MHALNPPKFSQSLWSRPSACVSILSTVWRLPVITLPRWDPDSLSCRMKSDPQIVKIWVCRWQQSLGPASYKSTEITFYSWGACMASYGDTATHHDTATAIQGLHREHETITELPHTCRFYSQCSRRQSKWVWPSEAQRLAVCCLAVPDIQIRNRWHWSSLVTHPIPKCPGHPPHVWSSSIKYCSKEN